MKHRLVFYPYMFIIVIGDTSEQYRLLSNRQFLSDIIQIKPLPTDEFHSAIRETLQNWLHDL